MPMTFYTVVHVGIPSRVSEKAAEKTSVILVPLIEEHPKPAVLLVSGSIPGAAPSPSGGTHAEYTVALHGNLEEGLDKTSGMDG